VRLPAILVLCLLATASVAAPWRLEVGPVAGAVSLDPALADYRWATTPSLQAGLATAVGRNRWRLGLRLLRSETTQGTGLGAAYADPTVQLTSAEVLGRYTVVRTLGVDVSLAGHAGWLHLGYTPDRLDLASTGGAGTVTVDYRPVDEAVVGGGLELRRGVGRRWAVALAADASSFALDTAHRRGDAIVESRERFWNWSARLTVAWRTTLGRGEDAR
jgi:hypothetical protein